MIIRVEDDSYTDNRFGKLIMAMLEVDIVVKVSFRNHVFYITDSGGGQYDIYVRRDLEGQPLAVAPSYKYIGHLLMQTLRLLYLIDDEFPVSEFKIEMEN